MQSHRQGELFHFSLSPRKSISSTNQSVKSEKAFSSAVTPAQARYSFKAGGSTYLLPQRRRSNKPAPSVLEVQYNCFLSVGGPAHLLPQCRSNTPAPTMQEVQHTCFLSAEGPTHLPPQFRGCNNLLHQYSRSNIT